MFHEWHVGRSGGLLSLGLWEGAEIRVKDVKGLIEHVEIEREGVLYDEMVKCRDHCGVVEVGVCECSGGSGVCYGITEVFEVF